MADTITGATVPKEIQQWATGAVFDGKETVTETVDDPDEAVVWVDQLARSITRFTMDRQVYKDYYDGKQTLAYATSKFREKFGALFGDGFSANVSSHVLDAVEERLNVEGFQFGADDTDNTLASQAWEWWQANNMDEQSELQHIEAMCYGRSFAMVQPAAERGGVPVITAERATEVGLARDMMGQVRAGLKMFVDEWTGKYRSSLFTPDGGRWDFVSKGNTFRAFAGTASERWEFERYVEPVVASLGVPIVEVPNRPTLGYQTRSELLEVKPMQDALNKMIADLMVASELAAYKQRIITGIEQSRDPITHQILDDQIDMSRMLVVESDDPASVRWGTFDTADLTSHINAIEMLLLQVAIVSRTPPHFLSHRNGLLPSGDAIRAAESGLASKATRRARHFGGAHEDTIRKVFLAADTAGAPVPAAVMSAVETQWSNPAYTSEGARVDALTKLALLGVPYPMLWRKSTMFTAAELEELSEMADSESFGVNQITALLEGEPSKPAAPPVQADGPVG